MANSTVNKNSINYWRSFRVVFFFLEMLLSCMAIIRSSWRCHGPWAPGTWHSWHIIGLMERRLFYLLINFTCWFKMTPRCWFFFSANPSDQEVLAQAAFDIRENFSVSRRFKPKEVFIVTWDRVGAYEKQTDKVSLRICKGDEYVCGISNFDYRSTLSNWWLPVTRMRPTSPFSTQETASNGSEARYVTLKL